MHTEIQKHMRIRLHINRITVEWIDSALPKTCEHPRPFPPSAVSILDQRKLASINEATLASIMRDLAFAGRTDEYVLSSG